MLIKKQNYKAFAFQSFPREYLSCEAILII